MHAIRTQRGKALEVTPTDRLWLLRAVAREGPPRDLVAQTLVNRWAFLADARPGLYPSLADLVRAYAQPVNPRWMPGGGLYERRIEHLKRTDPSRVPLEQRRARRRVQYAEATEFAPEVEAAVQQALSGPITIPRGAVHFHARRGRPFPELIPGAPGRNTIYSAQGAEEALYAPIAPRSGVAAGVLALVLVAAVAAWRWADGRN